mmetsp:Transcript_28596/g.25309  ORF Transcript_28596/g.25309 Transcript_28596/m.25309 type:complete len:129 (-) Transcript_28596:40-426(-)
MSVKVTQKDIAVEKEDQLKINQFSRLNMKLTELKEDIKRKQEELDALEDAELAIEETMDDDGLKLFLGEVMIDVDEDQATKYQEKFMDEKKNEMDDLEEGTDEIESNMKELKTYLYAKFGGAINLEQE